MPPATTGGAAPASSKPKTTQPGILQTVDRALQVLLCFDTDSPELGVTDIAEAFGFNKSMAQRLLATLAYRGFLTMDPDTHRYRIGPSARSIGLVWERSNSLRRLVTPLLRRLSAETGGSAVLALPDHFHMRTVATVDGATGPLRVHPLIDELYPAHAGATSKAFYAYLPAAQRQSIFTGRPVARFTGRTVTEAGALESQFAQIRTDGFAYTVGEYDSHVACVAVIVTWHGEPFASLSVAGPEESFVNPTQHVPALRSAATAIENLLWGHTRLGRR